MRFVIFVEGWTESRCVAAFLKKWLNRRLKSDIGITTVRFDGWPDMVKEAPKKARMHLDSPGGQDVISVISLLDLYGPTIYPPDKKSAEDRKAWMKRHMENGVDHERYRHFSAVHETEAWLLSDPGVFSREVARELPDRCSHPETVNSDEPPARLLDKAYLAATHHHYKKVVDGMRLFAQLDPDIAHDKCPALAEMLDTMLALAKDAGL